LLGRFFRRTEQPVYVVAGFKRSGTTMLMQALEAGGVPVDRAPQGDENRPYYELSRVQRKAGWADLEVVGDTELPIGQRFPFAHRGRLIKTLTGMARYLDPMPKGYVVVFIHRDADAINASAQREFGYTYSADNIDRQVTADLLVWRTRNDCDVRLIEVAYDDVLADPLGTIRALKRHGFPIRHVNRAARVIDTNRPHLKVVA